MTNAATRLIQRTYRKPYPQPTTAERTRTADEGLIDTTDSYNNFVWALARKFTNSPEEAEAAVREMLSDIQQCAENDVSVSSNEDQLISRIAWRRLLKFLQ